MDESLRQPCPDLSEPANSTAGALLTWGVATAKAYRLCQADMQALINATGPTMGAGTAPKPDYTLAPPKK